MSENVPVLLDHLSQCGTYSAVISRHRESFVKNEEISQLQEELELLLSDAESRLKWLQAENDNIDSDKPVSSDSDGTSMSPRQLGSSRVAGYKRGPGRPSNDRVKNVKLSNRLFKNKIKKSELAEQGTSTVTDAPFKFWQTLDVWCSDITEEDISKLTELIKSSTPEDEFFKVPALGIHYSQQWAAEDLLSEQNEGTEPHCRNAEISNITSTNVFRNDKITNHPNSTVGPLTERLLNALIEEKVIEKDPITDISLYEDMPSPPKSTKTSVDSASHVEIRIREELIDLGVLNESDNESEDEVLTELVAKQQELRELTEYNKTQLQLLKDTALEYMKQQDVRHRIDMLDESICDTYRNFMLKKHKKIPYTKKEKEQVSKLLSERDQLNNKLQENSFLSMT